MGKGITAIVVLSGAQIINEFERYKQDTNKCSQIEIKAKPRANSEHEDSQN
jgi:hypothetical protein